MKRLLKIATFLCIVAITPIVNAQNDALKTSASTPTETSLNKDNSSTATLEPMPHKTYEMEIQDKEMENETTIDPAIFQLFSPNREPTQLSEIEETSRVIVPKDISIPLKTNSTGLEKKAPNTLQDNML